MQGRETDDHSRTERRELLDGRRRELLADLAHELTTPLSIILGLSVRLLHTERLDPAHVRDVDRIRANAYVLLKQAEDLLQLARLDSGRLPLSLSERDVARLVRDAAAGFAEVAAERGQRLVVRVPRRLRARVDEGKILAVVSNLLANAVKFTPSGGVIRVSLAASQNRLRLEVGDSGPGIPPALREAVFERYTQAPVEGPSRGGTGLGLSIVRELVVLHGGTATIGEAPEGGALIAVELPYEPVEGLNGSEDVSPLVVGERQRPTLERLRAQLGAGPGPEPAAEADTAEARFDTVFASAPIGMAVLSVDHRWKEVNRTMCAMLGRGEAELLHRSADEVTHPDDRECERHLVERVLAGRTRQVRVEKRFIRGDGRPAWVVATTSAVRDASGRAVALLVHAQPLGEGHEGLLRAVAAQNGRAWRHREHAVLFVVDLSGLHDIHRRYGPHVVARLVHAIRDEFRDRVGRADYVGRLSWNRLAVLVAGLDADRAPAKAADLREAAEAVWVPAGHERAGTPVAVGTAVVDGAHDAERVVLQAELGATSAPAPAEVRDRPEPVHCAP